VRALADFAGAGALALAATAWAPVNAIDLARASPPPSKTVSSVPV